MKSKFSLTVLTVFMLVVTLIGNAGIARAEAVCDPAFVLKDGNVITVKPTGVADTTNLQCAFDLAVATGPGVEVRLLVGTYHTSQIVVNDFHGMFIGAGLNNTVVTNLPNLYVTPEDVILYPPSTENPWPALFSFLEGDYTISDMAVKIKGEQPTLAWTIFGIDPPIRVLSSSILMTGNQVNARIERVLVEGEPIPDPMFGYNLINGVIYEGYYGDPIQRISGSLTVSDSIFRSVLSGTPLVGSSGGFILIKQNTYENVFLGLDGGDFINSSFEFSHNKVDAVIGMDLYNAYTPEDAGNKYLIKNNVFRGAIGIALEQNFGAGNTCLLVGNNVQNVTELGILLGPGTKDCTVVGGSNKTNVLDLGTDNILVGINNMGTGVGPTIQHFMKIK